MFKGPSYQLREKQLSLRRRSFASTCLSRTKAAHVKAYILRLALVFSKVRDSLDEEKTLFWKERIARLCLFFFKLVEAPSGQSAPLRPIDRLHMTIDSLQDDAILPNFRFRSKADLHALMVAFQIPGTFTTSCGHVYHGEESLLVSLHQDALSRPNWWRVL
jgi:hypothetical protein